jgi:hypothetical protein
MSDYKGKEIEHLRQSDDSIGEKVDFATLIWRQIDQISRMRQLDLLTGGRGTIYFSAVQGLVDLLSGIEDKPFRKELEDLDNELEKLKLGCAERNKARKVKDDSLRESPQWLAYGRRYFVVCMKFIQAKGFGFTEIETEKI